MWSKCIFLENIKDLSIGSFLVGPFTFGSHDKSVHREIKYTLTNKYFNSATKKISILNKII